jgi:cysteine-rich repeat protein
MKAWRATVGLTLALVVLTELSADAARPTGMTATGPGIELASGARTPGYRVLDHGGPPAPALPAWARFAADRAGPWRASWDRATGVPTRIYGGSIPVPGAMRDAAVAEAAARELLARHIDLLAPGASPADFRLASNLVHAGIRSVGFWQYQGELRVLGGQVSFRFKNDRLFMIASEALPHVVAPRARQALAVDAAVATARGWMTSDHGRVLGRPALDGPLVLPLVDRQGAIRYHTAVRVELDTAAPVGRWEVYVDATTGQALARRQTLLFADGALAFEVPVRHPGSERRPYPAAEAEVVSDGDALTTDAEGALSWPGDGKLTFTAGVVGLRVKVINARGTTATEDLVVAPSATAVWSAAEDELIDAQLTTFAHTMAVKAYVRRITPDMAWLDESINATVNIDDTCNAFSDGTNINFFTSGGGCANTGRLADVVYHEFGHAYHTHSIVPGVGAFDGALSEGAADYLAATITNDSGMGRGFFLSSQPLRELDPPQDKVWPDDVIGQVHTDGEIIAGALWDLRKALIAELGYDAGVSHADFLFQAALARATDIPTMYPELLAADDDDGDLANGTPLKCVIDAALGAHGLRDLAIEVTTLGAEPPSPDGFPVAIRYRGLTGACPGDDLVGATLGWERRDATAAAAAPGSAAMIRDGNAGFVGALPPAPPGTVLRYRIDVEFEDGTTAGFPANQADPWYELYVGQVVELYCTDFERDPATDGWTHGLSRGTVADGADDWAWGEPAGVPGSGDPVSPFSGSRVFGNDLGGDNFNGSYQPNKTNYAYSPRIATGTYSDVRLQYRRWLNVEDGHFDRATIYANGAPVWRNVNSNRGDESTLHHRDREWRFQDVDLSERLRDGAVQLRFELSSDGGLEFGGWTLDDLCVVASPGSLCGDGRLTGVEQCDDGAANADAHDACRTSCRLPACGDGIVDTDEQCDDANDDDGDDCLATCTRPPGFEADGLGCGCHAGDGAGGIRLAVLAALAWLALVHRRRPSR